MRTTNVSRSTTAAAILCRSSGNFFPAASTKSTSTAAPTGGDCPFTSTATATQNDSPRQNASRPRNVNKPTPTGFFVATEIRTVVRNDSASGSSGAMPSSN